MKIGKRRLRLRPVPERMVAPIMWAYVIASAIIFWMITLGNWPFVKGVLCLAILVMSMCATVLMAIKAEIQGSERAKKR